MFKKATFLFLAILIITSIAFAKEKYPFLGEITANNVNVRAGQSTNFERLHQFNQGDKVVVVGKEYSWYEVRLPEQAKCFIAARYIKKRQGNIGQVTASRVNLRAGAGEQFGIIGKVYEGSLVKIKEKNDEWYKIEPPDSCNGWIHNRFLVFKSSQVPSPKIVKLPSRNIYRKRGSRTKVDYTPPKSQAPKQTSRSKSEETGLFAVIGYIRDLGRIVQDKDIRYKLVVDENMIYYLKVPRHIIDSFVNYKAKIQGEIQEGSVEDYSYPVIIVRKINLVL